MADMEPELPYAGSSGHSGSPASKERADRADRDGTTSERQSMTIYRLTASGSHGMTWRELAASTGWHHGQASAVLSVLHKAGKIERLAERRSRCHVYVMPIWSYQRELSPYRQNKTVTIQWDGTKFVCECGVAIGELGLLAPRHVLGSHIFGVHAGQKVMVLDRDR
jgi:hypothetical protein